MLLSEVIADYMSNSPAGVVIDAPTATKYLLQALRYYCGYAELVNLPPLLAAPPAPSPHPPFPVADSSSRDFYMWVQQVGSTAINYSTSRSLGLPVITPDFVLGNSPVDTGYVIATDVDLTLSELALIRPLFLLYVERENATHLEASRALGLEVYGRSVAEVDGDIKQLEEDMPKRAFVEPIWSV